jgi:hypothetical protein
MGGGEVRGMMEHESIEIKQAVTDMQVSMKTCAKICARSRLSHPSKQSFSDFEK